MSAKAPSGGTPFEDMSHEQMLAWLDQANSGTVQAAADRLIAAAKEIRSIAEDLKVRPQYVEWKGEGAEAFRTWAGDLANSTLRLGDFSEDAAKWLGQTSGAIATAQASIPRDMPGAKANLAAAQSAHNDPDAAAVSAKSRSELDALTANREKVRLEAAAQMRKLGQTYQVSATEMGKLERPKFPPPPEAFVPVRENESADLARPAVSGQGVSQAGAAPVYQASRGSDTRSDASTPRQSSAVPSPERRPTLDLDQPTRMGIDSVGTLPPHTQSPHGVPDALPSPDQLKNGPTPQTGTAPPAFGPPVNTPVGQGRSPVMGRTPFQPGQGATANPVGMARGGTGSGSGVVGGRPVPQASGRSMGIPRGTVVGGEGMPTRGPMGPTAGSTNPIGQAMGQQGQTPGRRISNGGVIGGRPLPNEGTGTARPQQPGRAGAAVSRPGYPGSAASPGTAGRGAATPGNPATAANPGTAGRSASRPGTPATAGRGPATPVNPGTTANPGTAGRGAATPVNPATAANPGTAGRGVVGGTSGAGRHGERQGAAGSGASHRTPANRTPDSNGNGRPYGVVEDEETWRQGIRPAMPPVID
ncbi:translation initiation factor IF-2 [Streptomyces sp. NPDC006332]|uniref:translation initiation factor IF-2 n=1 Tax=Streptomyces sp. NPDC006332 TaxID=3155456 RepID=UPI00339F3DDB